MDQVLINPRLKQFSNDHIGSRFRAVETETAGIGHDPDKEAFSDACIDTILSVQIQNELVDELSG